MTQLEAPNPDAPLVIRRSRAQVLAGFGFGVVGVVLMVAFTHGPLRERTAWLGGAFLALCLIPTVIELLDRQPRLILERGRIGWRRFLAPMAWASWREVEAVRVEEAVRHHALSWLHLTLTPAPDRSRKVVVKLDRLALDGDEVLEAIRQRAPHLRPPGWTPGQSDAWPSRATGLRSAPSHRALP